MEGEETGGKGRRLVGKGGAYLLGLRVILKDARQLFEEPEVTDPEKIEVC